MPEGRDELAKRLVSEMREQERVIARKLLSAFVRLYVGEYGRWDHPQDWPTLAHEACAALGVTVEQLREDYYTELYGEDRAAWPDAN